MNTRVFKPSTDPQAIHQTSQYLRCDDALAEIMMPLAGRVQVRLRSAGRRGRVSKHNLQIAVRAGCDCIGADSAAAAAAWADSGQVSRLALLCMPRRWLPLTAEATFVLQVRLWCSDLPYATKGLTGQAVKPVKSSGLTGMNRQQMGESGEIHALKKYPLSRWRVHVETILQM